MVGAGVSFVLTMTLAMFSVINGSRGESLPTWALNCSIVLNNKFVSVYTNISANTPTWSERQK